MAFFFPEYLGFLILFFPIPLVLFLRTVPGQLAGFRAGWWWGMLVFGIHFTWLLQLLLSHTKAGWLLSGVLYVVVVSYFALSSACWLWVTVVLNVWLGHISLIITAIAYWLFIENLIFMLPGLGTGYPFLNPAIPLASYPVFLKLLSLMIFGSTGQEHACPVDIGYIAPVLNRVKNTTAVWRTNAEAVKQKIYHQMCCYEQGPSLYVAPETTFPFPLNHYPEVTKLWSSILPDQSHLFMGSIFEDNQKCYQAVFWLQGSLIIEVYVKKLLTPFVEKIPTGYKHITWLKNIFLSGGGEFCDDARHFETEFFDVTPQVRIIPRICLEFFFEQRSDFERYKDPSKKVTIFFFANDSWFNSFFRTILERFLILKAELIGLPVVYIGHFGCKKIDLCAKKL